jgi:hypothetical protein
MGAAADIDILQRIVAARELRLNGVREGFQKELLTAEDAENGRRERREKPGRTYK